MQCVLCTVAFERSYLKSLHRTTVTTAVVVVIADLGGKTDDVLRSSSSSPPSRGSRHDAAYYSPAQRTRMPHPILCVPLPGAHIVDGVLLIALPQVLNL